MWEPDPADNNNLTVWTGYTYNLLDLLTTVTQGDQTRSYQYDSMGRLTQQTTPEGGQWSYAYNAFSQVDTRTDARGVITNYSCDSLNRLTQVSYNVGSTGVPATATVTYAYGAADDPNLTKRGRLITVTDGVGSEGYTYDNLGRVTQFQKVISGTTYPTIYGHNLAGQITSITYASGRVVSQSYNAIGRLDAMEGTFNSQVTKYVNTFQYDAATGFVNSFKYGDNAVDATFTYSSDRLQLSSLSYKKVGEQNPFSSLTYGYGAATSNNGQILSITDNVDSGRSVVYTYDALYRLKIAETVGSTNFPKWGLQWTYDRYGNRTAQSTYSGCQSPMVCPTSSFAVSTTTNRITDTGYSYDANGNMTADGRNALAYDAENRLVTNTYQGATTAYAHDGAGLRVKKCAPNCTSPTSTTVYIFSGAKVIAEYVNGNLSKEYVYSGSALIAIHEGSSLKFQMSDHLSARMVTDASGGVLEQRAHFPYGELWYAKDGPGNNIMPDKWQLTSYERDSESGNDYAMARSYINRFGRFDQPDPVSGSIGNPQSLNRYAYVLNDPVNLTDPSGLWPFYVSLGDNVVLRPGGDGGAGRGWQIPDTWSILAVAAVGTNVPSLDGRFVYSGGNAVALLWSPVGPQGEGPGGGRHVDRKILAQCIDERFGVNLVEFNEAGRGQNGSFAGRGPDTLTFGGNDADIYIINDVSRSSADLRRMAAREGRRAPPGVILVGLTLPSNPYRNYTSTNFPGALIMAQTQVHELGNSLQFITGAAFNPADLPPVFGPVIM